MDFVARGKHMHLLDSTSHFWPEFNHKVLYAKYQQFTIFLKFYYYVSFHDALSGHIGIHNCYLQRFDFFHDLEIFPQASSTFNLPSCMYLEFKKFSYLLNLSCS